MFLESRHFPFEEWKTNLMSLAILLHFLCAQHVPDINISIIRSLRLCCWITTSVVLFSVRCVLEIWFRWFWVVPVMQAEAQVVLQPAKRAPLKTSRTKSPTHNELRTRRPIQQHSRKLLLMDILMSETCWVHNLHDHPSCLCCPDALSMVGDPLSGNGCDSPNHI